MFTVSVGPHFPDADRMIDEPSRTRGQSTLPMRRSPEHQRKTRSRSFSLPDRLALFDRSSGAASNDNALSRLLCPISEITNAPEILLGRELKYILPGHQALALLFPTHFFLLLLALRCEITGNRAARAMDRLSCADGFPRSGARNGSARVIARRKR